MIEKDRLLLARMAKINQNLGPFVLELLKHQDGGELPADGLDQLGGLLIELGTDMCARAAQLKGVVIDAAELDIIVTEIGR